MQKTETCRQYAIISTMRTESWVTSLYPYHNSHVAEFRRNERSVARNLGYVERLIELKDTNGVIQEFARHMDEPNSVGLVVSNHDQHVNIAAFLKALKIVNSFTKKPLSHDLIVTLSLLRGYQGDTFQRFALGMIPTLADNQMKMVGLMRDKDKDKYYSPEEGRTREDLTRDIETGNRNFRRVRRDFLSGTVIWFFPAGTTTEGTVNPETGKDYGMGDIDNEALAMYINAAIKQGKPLKILPLSLNGFNNIVPARETEPTTQAIDVMRWNILTRGRFPRYIAQIIPGELIDPESLLKEGVDLKDGTEVNRAILSAIAKNVNPERQGIFAKNVPREGLEPSRV